MITKITPHPCLEKIVDHYWIEKNGNSKVKILPDGSTSIIFNFGSPINIYGINGDYKNLQDSLIIGAQKKYYLLEEQDNTDIIGIKFRQSGAIHFLQTPMSLLSNKVVKLDDILNGESIKLRNLLSKTNDVEEVKKVLDYYLLIKADMLNTKSDIIDFAIKQVKSDGSPALIKKLCDTANISNKHLISLFNKNVGLSPKLIQRINKFIRVIHTINNRKEVVWPEIAYECNYFDQAHLINDFKSFSGISPKKYLDNPSSDGLRLVYS